MKVIGYSQIVDCMEGLTVTCTRLCPSALSALRRARDAESGNLARFALDELVQNAELAERETLPICQDTGMACVFVELGQDVHIEGGLLCDAVDEGIRRGYKKYGLRASVLDPITRVNTSDNTPAMLHVDIVSGDGMKITFLPKGFGSENMSKLYMLTPAQGVDGVVKSVLDAVKSAASKPCPPIIVGVGIGGTADVAMLLAKKQLLREVGSQSPDETLAALERELLEKINALGIGAQGFGGDTTALAVHIGKCSTHIAGLPVAVNIQCNAARVASATL